MSGAHSLEGMTSSSMHAPSASDHTHPADPAAPSAADPATRSDVPARHRAGGADPAPGDRPGRDRAASWSLVLSLVALLGGVVAMAGVGLSIVPMEAQHGRLLTDTPAWYQWAVLGAFGSLVLWTLAGIVGIVLAVIGLAAGQGRARLIIAIVLAVLAPFLALGVLMGALGAGTALL